MIRYSIEKEHFKLNNRRKITAWIKGVCSDLNVQPGGIQYIFVSDERILAMNRQFLKHDYYTDIITFDYSEQNSISGDIFISIDTVAENAKTYQSGIEKELLRVMIHGILHLAGFDDKTKKQQQTMRMQEDRALAAWDSLSASPLHPVVHG